MAKLVEQFEAAIAALEAQDLDGARAACDAAVTDGTSRDHVAIRYLEFMFSWLEASADEASLDEIEDMLADAVELDEPSLAGRIVTDLADVLIAANDPEEAEHALRCLCGRDDLDEGVAFDARSMRIEIALDYHEDPDEALEVLAELEGDQHCEPGYASLHAGVLMELGRTDEALEALRDALAANDDTELRYQLGMMLRAANEDEAAIDQLLTVRARDLEIAEISGDEEVPRAQAEDLKRQLEEVLDTLPDPVIRRVASVAIQVGQWPSEDAIRAGADPRSAVYFAGEPETDEGEDGNLEAIVIYCGVILEHIEDDDDIIELLTLGLVEEFDRFFGLELIPGV